MYSVWSIDSTPENLNKSLVKSAVASHRSSGIRAFIKNQRRIFPPDDASSVACRGLVMPGATA